MAEAVYVRINGSEGFRSLASNANQQSEAQMFVVTNLVSNTQTQDHKMETQFGQLSGQDNATILKMDRIVDKVNSLEIKMAQMSAAISSHHSKPKSMIDRKSMYP